MPTGFGWLALLFLTLPGGPEPASPSVSSPLWVAFDVVNPAVVGGHRILHLEDIVGPDQRRDIAELPAASAVLLFSVRPDECGLAGACADVARWTAAARAAGAVVVAVVLVERDRADTVRARLTRSRWPIAIALDAHGVVRALAGLAQPGTFVVIDSKGRSRRWTPSSGRGTVSGRALDEVRAALEDAASPTKAVPRPSAPSGG